MVDRSLFKIIIIVSMLTSAIAGLLAIIPLFTNLIICIVMFFLAPFILIYFKNLNLLRLHPSKSQNNEREQKERQQISNQSDSQYDSELYINTDQGIMIGGISGFFGFIGFSVIFLPCALLIDTIFKTASLFWVKVLFQNYIFVMGGIFLGSLLSALFNAFSGFLTGYFYQFIYTKKR